MAKDLDLSEFGGTPELDLSEFDQPAPQPASTARRAADTGLALGRGIVAVPETAVGLSNIVTGGRTGKAVERLGVRFKDAKQVLTDFQSDEQKAADARVQQADGFFPTVGAMVENPSTIANAVAESVPSMLAGGAVSRGLVNKGVGAITAGAVGEGVVSAGSAAEQVRQEGATGFLTPKQAALAATSGAATGVINRASGKLADKLGIADVNTTLATGKLGGGTERGVLRNTAYGAVNEGVLQELPQSMQEQALQNLALDKPVGEGVAEAAASGMLVGNLTGGALGAVSRSPQTPQIETDSPDVGAVNQSGAAPGVSPSVQGGGIAAPQESAQPPAAPPPPAPSKAQAMGINPAAGPLSAGAAIAVDTGADVVTQQQAVEKQKAEAAAKEKAKPGADGKKPEPEAPPPVQPVTPDPTAPITGPFTQAIHGASNVTPPPAPAVDPQGPAASQGAGTPADAPAAPGVGADQGPTGASSVPAAVPEPAQAVTPVAPPPTQENSNANSQARPGETIDPETGEITQSGAQGAGGDGSQRPADALQPGADAKGPQPAPGQPAAPAGTSAAPEGKPAAPVEPLDLGAHTAATSPHNDRPEPTQAQKEAGNAKLGHIVMSGLGLSIENPEGSTRRSKPDSPVKWETTMKDGHYGYVKGSIGMDGDHVDTFIKPGTPLDHAGTVFVIDQIDPATGKPDEHKVMIGYPNGMAARQAYQGNYQKGWKGFKAITPMAWDEFKAWVKSDGTKSPAARSEPAPVAPPPADTPVATDTTSSAVAPPAPDPAPTQAAAPSKNESVSPAAVGPSQDGTPDPAAGKWFGTKEKADEKLASMGLTETHEVVRDGLRFAFRKKALTAPAETKAPVPETTAAKNDTVSDLPERIAPGDTQSAEEWWGGLVPMKGLNNFGRAALVKHLGWHEDVAKVKYRYLMGKEKAELERLHLAATGIKQSKPVTPQVPPPMPPATNTGKGPTVIINKLGKDGLTDAERAAGKAPYNDPPPAPQQAPGSKVEAAYIQALDGKPFNSGLTLTAAKMSNAIREKNAVMLADVVNPDNKVSREAFRILTGVTLPKGLLATQNAVNQYLNPPAAPAPKPEIVVDKAEIRPYRRPDGSIGYEAIPISPPTPVVEPEPKAKPVASANTIFTEDAAAAARARLKAKLGRLNSGLDPETMLDGITLAGYHIEKGARTFAAYAKAMLEDLGDGVKPYLKSWYMGVKYDPKASTFEGMSSAAEVEAASVDLETQPEKADTAPEVPNDPTPPTIAPAVNQPLDAGQPAPAVPGTDAVRGVQQPRAGDGRPDDPGLRDQRGREEGPDDALQNLGDRAGDAGVSDRPADTVGADRGGVPARDFRPAAGGLTRTGSWHETAKRNLDLIDLAIKIDSEKRQATPEEQEQLSKYVGFGAGAIRNEIFPVPSQWDRQQNPGRLIFPDLVRSDRWKPLAERAAALPIEWQRTILQSTQYAHYTSEGIIRSIWSAAQRLGFTGGKIMEPGDGIGSFAMLMPETVHKTSKYTGIEFDGPTALIGKLLLPEQNMLHADFIKRNLPDNFYDLVVGNPPFSQTPVLGDPRYEKHGFMLHDYFFAKSMDKVRPGGLLAFVTSKGTMDKKTDKARKFLSERADFLGAIRLPSTAFEDNAGTSVVTDVIFLRKRVPGEPPAGKPWTNLKTVATKDGPVAINEYYADNPQMVLGQHRISGNVDDEGRRINSNGYGGERYTLVSYDKTPAELDAKFSAAIEQLPANVYSPAAQGATSVVRETAKMDFDPKIKREGVLYVGKDGDLLRVEEGTGKSLSEVVKLSDKDRAWLTSYVGLRDLIQEARQAQVTDGNWQAALKKLNKAYDAFVAKHGPINAFRSQVRTSNDEEGNPVETTTRVFTNRRLYREDYDSAIVTQIEMIDEDGNIKKAPFLLGRTVGKPVSREVKTIGDALAVSLDEIGRLDIGDVAARLGIKPDEAIEALDKQVYKTPTGQWQLADEYLSGDVVTKLEEAMEAARLDRTLERNVEALREVQPEKLGPSQISVKLGTPWVGAKHVSDFAKEIEAGAVTFDPKTETWQVEGGNMRSERKAGAEFGTAKRSPSEILEAVLNSRSIKVMKTVSNDSGKGTKDVVDTEATTAANEVAKKMKEKFRTWVWTDSERAADLVEAYNLRYNNIAPRRFDGSHLTLPGVSLRYKLHPHQLRAIWRQIQTGNTNLAHAVGAGKTIEMIAGGMEQKRLGLIKKPIYAVPNHMLEQFANEFMELYPLANIMVADDQNFSKERRKAFIAAATLNAPDAIVITHSAFERIGVKPESVQPIIDEIISDLQDELESVGKDSGARVRRGQLEQQIEAVNQRFDSILAAGKKDGTVSFEEMGVDFIYVDEAHTYRKLDFHTAQTIKGIDPNGSRRALDMYVKTRWLEKQRPGRSMTFASGTPVTNTMGEIYTIMRFFAPEILERGGIATFDSWARMFGEVKAALEPNAAGKYEVVERFSRFDNVPELMSRVRQFMDVLQSDQLGAIVKRPDTEGGKPQMILVEPTKAMLDYQKNVLLPRLEQSRKWKPSFEQPNNPDPVIAIITDGRFAATDPRFIPGGKVLKGEITKIDKAADEILAEYKATAKNQYVDRDGKPMVVKGGTQIVFYNVGFGANAAASRGFNSRAVFTRRLVDGGIRREQIAWFDDADTDAKKEAVFKGMRAGTYRVLIGSAKKMGTGVNVQNRLTALHYMDPPWFPADVEQPRGRIIRQGNQNAVVREKWYATKGGYDSTMWQMVGRKQRFIDQAFSGDKNLRSMEDLGEASLYEQAAALASGDPRAMQLAGLKQDVERLERQQAAHANEQVSARTALQRAQWDVDTNLQKRALYEKARKAIGNYFTFTSGKVGGTTYTKQTEFGQALKDAFNREAKAAETNPGPDVRPLATLGDGITLEMHAGYEWKTRKGADGKDHSEKVRSGYHELTITAGGYTMTVAGSAMSLGADTDAMGLARKAVNALNGVESDLRRANAALAELEVDQTRLRKKIGAPFEYQQEMLEKHAELQQLEEELRLEGLQKSADRIMLDDKGRGWKIVKGPYKQDGVMLVMAERMNEEGQQDTQELRYDSLKDMEQPQPDAPAAKLPDAPPAAVGNPPFGKYQRLQPGSRHLGQMGFNSPDTRFARSNRTGGVHMDDAEAIIAQVREALPTAPPIIALESIAQAPADLRKFIREAGAQDDFEAAYHNGKIYVLPSNVGSATRLQFLLAHHEIRHHGLASMLGPRKNQVLFAIHATNANVRAAAAEQIRRGYATSKVLATEEALADMAVEDLVKLNGWDKIVAAVRQWLRGAVMRLRRAGLGRVADAIAPSEWTDKDVAYLIARAEGVSRGGSAKYASEGTVFGQDGDMPAFYSALTREINANTARAQPAMGWASTIQGLVKAGKIKQDEVDWSGVLDWLKLQEGKVTREQVAQFLDANGVRVEETVLAGPGLFKNVDEAIDYVAERYAMTPEEVREEYGYSDEQDYIELARSVVDDRPDATKYAAYQLPGGTNYREVLLTLPAKEGRAWVDRAGNVRQWIDGEPTAEVRSAMEASGLTLKSLPLTDAAGTFKSGHWDEPNILAHIRVNDRTDSEGKRVLFVEEIQSDWGQEGKKAGFGQTLNPAEVDWFNKTRAAISEGNASEEDKQKWMELNLRSAPGKVPSAPFVTKTDAWLSLALKRIVKMAVDEGYDRVAFINGDQSAERYDLSKQVDKIRYRKDGDDNYQITVIKDNETIFTKTKQRASDIESLVGKDIAKKMVNGEGAGAGVVKTLEGLDLKVGGSGMKAFYDKIVPSTLKDVLRKVGGGALETVDIGDGVTSIGMVKMYTRRPATESEAAEHIDRTGSDEGLYIESDGKVIPVDDAVNFYPDQYDEGSVGDSYINAIINRGYGSKFYIERENAPMPQPGFTITPAMREKAAGGLPLFARGDKITEFNSDGPAKEFERYKRLVDQVGQEYTAKGSTMTFEEFTAKVKPLQDKMWEAHFKLEKWKAGRPATSTEEVFPGFQEIPIGTRILATHGLKYPEPTMGTVVGRRGLRMGEKAYVLPEVDFGDGDGRAVLPGDIKEVFAGPRTMFARGGLDSVTDKINTTTKTAGNTAAHYRGLGLQALGRRQITELYGDILPQLGSYNTLMAQMDADKNEAGAQADQIAQDWGKLKDERQLAELMHDATLAQMDPEKPLMRGDDPLTYEPLRERYAALSPEAKKVYADARDAYRTHHENVRKALRDRIERSELRGQRKAELLKQMDDEFYQSVKGVYFPLARFGDYVVIVRDPTGKTLSVNRAESINEAEALQVELRKAYPDMTVGKVLKSKEFNAGRDAVGRGFMQNLYEALGKADMDDKQRGDLEDMLGQLYLSALPDLSWAKHGIHRKGTPGFSQDARRAFAQNTFHGARYLAKVRYSDLLENELSDAQKQVDGMNESESFDSVKAQQVIDEMVKRHDAAMNPEGNSLSTALTSIGFVFHLGLSPASAVVNLTQTALVAYPIMGAKWGFDKAAAALLKASQQAAANRNDISAALSPEEKLAYNEAVRSGVIDVTMAHDLAGISQGEDAKVSWKLRPVMRWASFLFHHAEKFNRQATFVAAYRLAREAGSDTVQAYEQATKATYDGHFDYSNTNRPRIMQGNAAKVILLFKQYGQNMVYTLARQAYLSIKGKNQFERAQARKALGGLLTMHAAAAGVLGLPMVSTLLAAASMLGSDDDEPWDAEVALRNMLAEALGDQAADVLARGLSRLTPWDISGRVGLDKLILPDIQEGLEGQRLGESAMAAALGPVAGIGVALLKGMQEISDGNFARGLEAMAPSLLRGPARAVRYASEGAIDKTGKPIVEDVGAFGIAGQALGFSPSEVRLATEAKSAVHQADAKLAKRRATLMRHYAMAVIAGDEEGAADAREDIRAFNEKNPGRRINPLQMARSVATRKKQIAESQGGVYLPKTRRDAMEAGQFGMP